MEENGLLILVVAWFLRVIHLVLQVCKKPFHLDTALEQADASHLYLSVWNMRVDSHFQLMQALGQVDHVGLLKPKELEREFDH